MGKLKARRSVTGAAVGIAAAGAFLFAFGAGQMGAATASDGARAAIGEARPGMLTVALPPAVGDVKVYGARAAGRPIVVIDPGHGGHDPGAESVSKLAVEKQLALALARELRDLLVERGRVRVALTREDDRYLTLDQRASIARRLGAAAFVSLHMDSAPNPLARGATAYSLSEVASDAEAARFARNENAAGGPGAAYDGSVRAILADLSFREQMTASAELAQRVVRKSAGRVLLRPQPHRFAAFHVLRRAESPAVLVEAGYVSNVEDEKLLISPEYRSKLALALAQAIETDVAARRRR